MTHAVRVRATLKDGKSLVFSGREAWTLAQLNNAGKKGVTPIERPAPRWSHYVMMLRRAGLDIETIHEKHGGTFAGTHGRYVLHTPVRLEGLPPPERKAKKKPASGQEKRASNPKSKDELDGGLDET